MQAPIRLNGPLSPDEVDALTRHAQELARQRELARLAGRIRRAALARNVGEVARLGAQVRALQAQQQEG